MADALPRRAGRALDTAPWEQTPRVGQHLVVQLLGIIQQQPARLQALEARLADREARMHQRAHQPDRPAAADPPDERPPTHAGPHGQPGAKPGPPGPQQALLAATEVIAVKPSAGVCGQTACWDIRPYYTHQVIERPEIPMIVRQVVLYAAACPRVAQSRQPRGPGSGCRAGPRLMALIGALSGGRQRDSRRAVQEICRSGLGVPIGWGARQAGVRRPLRRWCSTGPDS